GTSPLRPRMAFLALLFRESCKQTCLHPNSEVYSIETSAGTTSHDLNEENDTGQRNGHIVLAGGKCTTRGRASLKVAACSRPAPNRTATQHVPQSVLELRRCRQSRTQRISKDGLQKLEELAAHLARDAQTTSLSLRAYTHRLAKAGWLQTTS